MTSQPLASFTLPGKNYGYTGTPVDDLQSWENTLALGLLDESGSTGPFKRELELMVKAIVGGLAVCPKKDNIMYYHAHFDTTFREVHGWLPVLGIDLDVYDGCWAGGGQTALYDSVIKVIEFLQHYAEQQAAKRYICNGVVYILTDGRNFIKTPGHHASIPDVAESLQKALRSEILESLVTILIGINDDPATQADLKDFAANAGFTAYIPAAKADKHTLNKLAGVVSSCVISQSQKLGQGGPSDQIQSIASSLTF